MKKILLFTTVFAFGLLLTISLSSSHLYQDDPFKKAEENYNRYCIGCHFDINDFFERDWENGRNIEGAYTSIKYGLPDIGMPAFGRTFTDDEMLELSKYIMNKGNKSNTLASEEKDIIYKTEELDYKIEAVVEDLEIPWGMTWLPNGDMLVTERNGRLTRNTKYGNQFEISGLPPIYVYGQGGLLDIELHPEYEKNGWIYISYSYFAGKTINDGGSTALMRARLKNDKLVDTEILWKASPTQKKGVHFGSRIEFDVENHVFVTIGDRGVSENAQDISNYSGSVHRLNDDGSIPKDNPFVGKKNAVPSLYNYGHRNIQGLAMHPESGKLWSHEHGPRGGDEINIEEAGKNYGWPSITYGINYNGTIITEDTTKAGMEQPILHWTPSIAPCGMDFIEGTKYTGWENNLLVGSLRFKYVLRCEIKGDEVVHQERIIDDFGRVRNVKVSPDGYIYVAVENPGRILKIIPQ